MQPQERQKWVHPNTNVVVDDMVLVLDSVPMSSWALSRVVNVTTGKKGL